MDSVNKNTNIKLLVSKEMTDRSKEYDNGGLESRVIRFPRASRESVNTKKQIVEIGVGNLGGAVTLEVKKAYQSDLSILKKMIEKGTLTEEEASIVGFVTQAVWETIHGGKPGKENTPNAWVSDTVANITIGTDPEFGLYKEGELFPANSVPALDLISPVGCDNFAVEIRPDAHTDHKVVAKNAIKLLKETGAKLLGDFDWRATAGGIGGGIFRPFGGHIHIGVPKLVKTTTPLNLYTTTMDVLNDLVAVPLVNLDVHFGHERRNLGTKYGNPNKTDAIRVTEEGRWEWRVLSGVIMASPSLLEAVLGVTKACVEHTYSTLADGNFSNDALANFSKEENKAFTKLGRFPKQQVIDLLVSSPKEGLDKDTMSKCITRLKGLDNYSQYKDSIDTFSAFVKTKASKLDFSMKSAWVDGKDIL